MRKLALGLVLALLACAPARAQTVGPTNAILCNKTASFTGTGAAAAVINGVASQNINVCGWHVTSTSSTTTTFQITAGTTGTCGTGTITITPPLNVTITAPSADHIDYASWSAGQANNICVNAPATVTGLLFYSQF